MSELILLCFIEISVLSQLLRRRKSGVELDLLDPLLLLLLVVRPEQELGPVAGVEAEHELPLGVVVRHLHARLEDHQWRTRGFGLEEVFLIFEEAHQLAAQNCVVRFPRSMK